MKIDLSQELLEGAMRSLDRTRLGVWSAFALTLVAGLICGAVWNDATLFARIGSIGVVIGVLFARWRYLMLTKLERRLGRILRDPQGWFDNAIKKQFPEVRLGTGGGPIAISSDFIKNEVDRLIAELDKLVFRDEAAIIIISTLVWGYGDWILHKIYCTMAC